MWPLRGVARSCGPILVLFAVVLIFSHITLLRLLLPFRFIVAECLVGGGWLSPTSSGEGFGSERGLFSLFSVMQVPETLSGRKTPTRFVNSRARLPRSFA